MSTKISTRIQLHTAVPVVASSFVAAAAVLTTGHTHTQTFLILLFAATSSLFFNELISHRGRVASIVNKKTTELYRLAYQDSLTGLPNRRCFLKNLEKKLARSNFFRQKNAVLMIDLNRFKQVIDSLGHDAGEPADRTLPRPSVANACIHLRLCRWHS